MNFRATFFWDFKLKIKVGDAVPHERHIDVIFSLILIPFNISNTCFAIISYILAAKHALFFSL